MATATTTASLALWLFSVVPIVLLVISSILLDRTLRYETLLHRSQIQIGIWLALLLTTSIALQISNDDNNTTIQPQIICLVWAHLAVFFALVGILVQGLQKSYSAAKKPKTMELGLSILPFSCLCSILVVAGCFLKSAITNEATLDINSLWKFSLLSFCATFLAGWLIKVLAIRRTTMDLQQQGMPTTVATTTEDSVVGGGIMARLCGMTPATSVNYTKPRMQANPWLDERQWYTWNRVQTMQWFAQQLKSTDEPARVLSILQGQSIIGEVLDNLSISQLVALKVPFGPAVLLSNAIAGLVDRSPKPRILNGVLQRTRREASSAVSNDCLDLHDHEYNNQEPERSMNQHPSEELQREAPQTNPPPIPEKQPIDYSGGGGMSEEQHEKLNQVMKDRFGLELPKLRATDFLAVQKGLNKKNDSSNGNVHMPDNDKAAQSQVSHPLETAPRNNYYANTTPTTAQKGPLAPMDASNSSPPPVNGIPQQILQGMPPHLQEIAKRRPDLVNTIWKQKHQAQQQQQQQQQLPEPQLPTARYQDLPALPEGDETEDEFDSDNEDETTSLIHRDHDSSRYKSVDKAAYPGIV